MAYEFLLVLANKGAIHRPRRETKTMKVQGRNKFGFSAALAVLPLAGILFTTLTACSVSDTTAPQTASLNDDDNHVPLKVDPPVVDGGGENGGGPTPPTDDGSGKGKNPPTSEDTLGGDN